MVQLTDIQLVLLSAASQREDGIIPVSDRLRGGAAHSFGTKLLALGYAMEVHARPGMPLWKSAEDGATALRITAAGLAAIGLEVDAGEAAAKPGLPPSPAAHLPIAQREGSKQGVVIDLLRREQGASVADLMDVTGWLPHTVRAVLSGLRKRGHTIQRDANASGSVYRIVAPVEADA